MAVHKTCQLPTRLKPFFYNSLPYSLSPFFLFNAEQHSRKLTLNSALKLRRHSGFSAFFVLSLSLSLQYFLSFSFVVAFFFFSMLLFFVFVWPHSFFQLRSRAVHISALGSSRM